MLYEKIKPTRYYLVHFKYDVPVALVGSQQFDNVWYNLIGRIGIPVDTDGKVVDSKFIAHKKLQDSPNMIATFTRDESNWKKSNDWYSIIRTDRPIEKERGYKEL